MNLKAISVIPPYSTNHYNIFRQSSWKWKETSLVNGSRYHKEH